ncbi:hypothetical protein AV530_014445 [Patagioenas fasciata monilis]|uniref:Uncharacterized protein n=1 Tax=Patagioenas fasciata monilis TaxID=372326 RepID=A0A1V4KC43_PATFA|nr:hypothetical protein AV530_014445 [Patagioenas fasciata monilis]
MLTSSVQQEEKEPRQHARVSWTKHKLKLENWTTAAGIWSCYRTKLITNKACSTLHRRKLSFHHREGNSWTGKVRLWQTKEKLSSHIPAKRKR